jgi:centromere DNA-binding complex CBF3 subunit-like protein
VAGFHASHGDYFLGRAQLSPPKSLLLQIWPWIEGWQGRFKARAQKKSWAEGGLDNDDMAAEGFLSLLAHL